MLLYIKEAKDITAKGSGPKIATINDKQLENNFKCVGKTAFIAGAVAGVVAACIPGPGWVVGAVIAVGLVAAAVWGHYKCKSAAPARVWRIGTEAQNTKIKTVPTLLITSCMDCPDEGGVVTASETMWKAWGKQMLTNVGHLANFAFGFLAGRGAAGIGNAGLQAFKHSVAKVGTKEAFKIAGKALGKSFWRTAKKELVQQFNPLKGWKKGAHLCNALRGLGLYGAYKQHYDNWTDDEKTLPEKLQATSVALILDVFAAKGMTYLCFPAGTKVHTKWGLANIESLEEGVEVLTYNEETETKEYKPILKTTRRTTPKMCIVELSNGETLRVTPEHRFYTDGKWVAIEELEVGDLLQTKEDVYLVIENKAIITTLEEVFNLEVEGNENYYVTIDGILVHNGYRKKYMGATPRKNSRTGREVFDRMLKEGTAREFDELGNAVKQFWDPDNKVWRNISEADMGHIHDAVTWWNNVGKHTGAKSPEVRKFMLDSDNYVYEYFRTNRSKGASLGQTYELPTK